MKKEVAFKIRGNEMKIFDNDGHLVAMFIINKDKSLIEIGSDALIMKSKKAIRRFIK